MSAAVPTKVASATEKHWVGQRVRCYIRWCSTRIGPCEGTVKGVSTNQVAAEDEGSATYDVTGLLVDIPQLGRNSEYGEWPVLIADAMIL